MYKACLEHATICLEKKQDVCHEVLLNSFSTVTKELHADYKRTIILRTSAREVACPYLCARDGYADEIMRELSGFCACAREDLYLCAEDLPRSCHPFQTGLEGDFKGAVENV